MKHIQESIIGRRGQGRKEFESGDIVEMKGSDYTKYLYLGPEYINFFQKCWPIVFKVRRDSFDLFSKGILVQGGHTRFSLPVYLCCEDRTDSKFIKENFKSISGHLDLKDIDFENMSLTGLNTYLKQLFKN